MRLPFRVPFEVAPGVVSDATAHATPGHWKDANNVRFRFGWAETIKGWEAYVADTLTGVCRTAFTWTNNYNQRTVAFGTHTALQVEFAGTVYDISPSGLLAGQVDASGIGAGGYGAGGYGMGGYGIGQLDLQPTVWSFATWGQELLACPRQGTLYHWDGNTGNAATEVTQAPDTINCILVPPDSRQVRAFGCTEYATGVYNPGCIRGSGIGDYTVWTPATSNNAFEEIIEGGEAIVSARTFSDRDAIWTKTGCYLGTFIGQINQKYRVDAVARDCGLAGQNAVAVYNRVAYWLTPDLRFYVWPFGGVPQELPCPILSDFQANLVSEQIAKVVASSVAVAGEIWWFYPDGRDGGGTNIENSRYVSYSIDEGVWSKGIIPRTAAHDNAIIGYPLAVDVSGNIWLHEKGNDAGGGDLEWFIEAAPQYVDEAERHVLIRDIWPDVKDQVGNVFLTVKLRDYPQATDRTKGPFTLTANASKYDFLAQGRLASIRFSGSGETFARIGRPSFDAVATGQR